MTRYVVARVPGMRALGTLDAPDLGAAEAMANVLYGDRAFVWQLGCGRVSDQLAHRCEALDLAADNQAWWAAHGWPTAGPTEEQ